MIYFKKLDFRKIVPLDKYAKKWYTCYLEVKDISENIY